MKRTLMHATCLGLMLALPGVVVAQQAERPAKERKGGGNDPVVMNAARDNLAEVQLGKLAAERAASDEVKKFAERMVTDHEKAYDELKQIADSKGLKVPTEPDSRTKKEYDRLAKTSGADFDRAYMDLMVREHDRDVKAFQRAAQNEKDPQIKDWAAKTLPTLQEHQKLAKETDSHVRTARKERGTPSASPDSTQK